MYYGIYKNVRDSAWQCLLDFHITTLPVDLLQITRAVGIPVIRNRTARELLPGEHAKSYSDGKHWVIIYNDALPIQQVRFAIAHELGHFLLGHALSFPKYASAPSPSKGHPAERQADSFATRLLCPSCVLWGLDLKTPEDIARYCRVPLPVAEQRHRRLILLQERNRFLTSPLEKAVYRQFMPFIRAQHRK